MVKLTDIAKACNTSVATVSYVLSGQAKDRRISPSTRAMILKTADELGYKKKNVVNMSKLPSIAFFVPQRGLETMYPAILEGLNAALILDPIQIGVHMLPYESNNIIKYEDLWNSKSYDAAVIFSANAGDLETMSKRKTKIPVVLQNRTLPGYFSVCTDQYEAGRLAALHAIAKGGTSIGLITNPSPFYGLNRRGEAFIETCDRYDIDMYDKIYYSQNTADAGYELCKKLIKENRLPKILVSLYDFVAYGCLHALSEAGIEIGDEVQVMSTSSSLQQLFSRSNPPMTVVNLHIEETTQKATRLAIDIASERLSEPMEIIVKPEIIYRASSPVPTYQEFQALEERAKR